MTIKQMSVRERLSGGQNQKDLETVMTGESVVCQTCGRVREAVWETPEATAVSGYAGHDNRHPHLGCHPFIPKAAAVVTEPAHPLCSCGHLMSVHTGEFALHCPVCCWHAVPVRTEGADDKVGTTSVREPLSAGTNQVIEPAQDEVEAAAERYNDGEGGEAARGFKAGVEWALHREQEATRELAGAVFMVLHDAKYVTHRDTLDAIEAIVKPLVEARLAR